MSSSEQESNELQNQKHQYTGEHYRMIQKHTPKLKKNTPPVCINKRSYELIIRRQASDTGEPFFECEICGKVTTEYGNLNKYCRIHMGEKPYQLHISASVRAPLF